jgi:alanine dehydrogenase
MLREGQSCFTYLISRPIPSRRAISCASGACAFAYETVRPPLGGLPLLRADVEVAGRIGVQAGAYYLEAARRTTASAGRRAGVDPADRSSILGGGCRLARVPHRASAWAPRWVLDRTDVLRALWAQFGRPLNTVFSTRDASRIT